jgi:UDP-N-acetylmuramoylalanine--D-glutamate ligase
VAAITGSNGKSTTTALAGAMLRAAGRTVEVCGNIGEALTACVEGEPGRAFVVELSSFQLETVDLFHPRVAALLNVSADHLDRHGGLDGYVAAKARIFHRQQPSDVAVLNAGDPRVRELEVVARRRCFASAGTVEDGCHVEGDAVVEVAPGGRTPGTAPVVLFRTADVPLPGTHNLENAMAAALVARACGADPQAITAALRSFVGLPHRLELVRERAGVRWYDDSKGTNLAATVRSLEGFADHSVHVILGGQFKGGDLGELRAGVERKARRAYLIGESADRFAAALAGAVAIQPCGILERAVAAAAASAGAGEVVLLSPACASFDQFDNFAQRGRVFQRLVRALDDGGGGHGAQARL